MTDCEVIVDFVNQLPITLIADLEQQYFEEHFEFSDSIDELQFVTVYKLFSQKFCSRFWVNKMIGSHGKVTEYPLIYAVASGQKNVVEVLLKTLIFDRGFVNLNQISRGETALTIALIMKHTEIVEMLIQTLENEDKRKRVDLNQDVGSCHQIVSLYLGEYDSQTILAIAKMLFCNENQTIRMLEDDFSDVLSICQAHLNKDNVNLVLSIKGNENLIKCV